MSKPADLVGKKFNQWTVLSRAGNVIVHGKKTTATWNCVCECGNKAVVPSRNLIIGASKSCLTCSYKRRARSNRVISIFSVIFNKKVAKVAKKRGVAVEMDEMEYYEIAKKPCHYCGAEPEEFNPYKEYIPEESIFVNGVDRVDSNGPYRVDNCVSCCKDCNYAKHTMPSDKFLALVERIYKHSILAKK